MQLKYKNLSLTLFLFCASVIGFAQQGILIGADTTQNIITTAVPFLTISPDARAAGMGDVGVATSSDANSVYWNPAKLVFNSKESGASISYTPWLGKIVNDMWLFYGSGFYKITREQAIGLSMRYFNLGDIIFRQSADDEGTHFNPKEFAISGYYSRQLAERLSIGVGVRYIRSNISGSFTTSTTETTPANSVAVDLGVYYDKDLVLFGKNSNLALGLDISNIGRKITYTDENNRDFIPTNLRFGTAYKIDMDPFNSIALAVDVNKLMVPTPDPNNPDYSPTLLKGMFSSFGDAPGGFNEEIKEYIIAFGAEYWYNNTFAVRVGYFNESADKGDRKYLTAGVGFRYQVFGIDFAYLLPKERTHPLAETMRFTLIFDFNNKKSEESVTE